MTKLERENLLRERLWTMMSTERALRHAGRSFIAGVDEVGRGPLAGPVVAAAVILPADFDLLGVDDSKKLSPQKRSRLCEEIKKRALCWALGWKDAQVIDGVNILQATKLAMTEAVENLSIRPDFVLIDGNFTIEALDLPQQCMVKGDANSSSIAAASIIAKVARDEYMEQMALKYPGYGFESNKGYGTRAHYAGLDALGPTPIHRKTFISSYINHK